MPAPFYSVIIPVYNGFKTIANALDSVKNQTFTDYEIIIVNDGSTDQTKTALANYFNKNSNLKYILVDYEFNKGVAHARNRGIKEAHAKYIAFLDADEIWFKDKLERVFSVIKQHGDQDLICHNQIVVRDNRKIGTQVTCSKVKNLYERLLFFGNCIYTSATVVKRSTIMKEGLFNENISVGEDYDCWLRMALNSNYYFFFLKDFLGEYRVIDNSLLGDPEVINKSIRSIVRYHYYHYFKRRTLLSRAFLYLRETRIIYQAAINSYMRDFYKESILYFSKSLLRNPFLWRGYVYCIVCIFKIVFSRTKS
ncbi:glycosyltransferase family 2 protein [Candidatus Omnitrophota bacterium]